MRRFALLLTAATLTSTVVPAHNPLATTGRDAAIAFLEPFFQGHPDAVYSIKRIIADGNLVAVHSHAKFTADERGLAVVDILRVEH
jgi:predicted SnoaL-like aldol condensation-catalyzing enzyme